MILFNDRSLIVAKVLFLAALFLFVSSCEGAMAHSVPKEQTPKETPPRETPRPETPAPGPNPSTPEADGCRAVLVWTKGTPVLVVPVECRYVAQTPPVRQIPKPQVQYPPVFGPTPIVTHVTRDYGPHERQLIHGKPEVKSYSVGQPRPKTVAVVKPPVVVKTAPKAQPTAKPKMQLPFGR